MMLMNKESLMHRSKRVFWQLRMRSRSIALELLDSGPPPVVVRTETDRLVMLATTDPSSSNLLWQQRNTKKGAQHYVNPVTCTALHVFCYKKDCLILNAISGCDKTSAP